MYKKQFVEKTKKLAIGKGSSYFGAYLKSEGFHVGLPLAWTITVGEILCGSLLVLGRYVRYCVIFHAVVFWEGLFLSIFHRDGFSWDTAMEV